MYQDLVALAQDRSPESRARLAGAMASLLDTAHMRSLPDTERHMILHILGDIIDETEAHIRAAISENIKDMPDAPHGLVTWLAKDDCAIARPILEHSPVLADDDLLDIIRLTGIEHMMAITKRPAISALVSDCLVEQGHQSVITSLLQNPSADIREDTFAWLVEESRQIRSWQDILVRRDDLPVEAGKRLYLWVDYHLRQFITDRFKLDPVRLDRLMDRSGNRLAHTDPAGWGNWSAADRLLRSLDDHNILSNSLILSALEAGHVALFLAHLMKKTGMDRQHVQRALFTNQYRSIIIVGRCMEMREEEIQRLITSLGKHAGFDNTPSGSRLEAIARDIQHISADQARYIVSLWNTGHGWRQALEMGEHRH